MIRLIKKNILFITIFSFSTLFSQRQFTKKQIDSSFLVLNADSLFNNKGSRIATELYYQSKQIGYTKGELKALRKLAGIEIGSSNLKKAFHYIKEAKSLAISSEDYSSYISVCFLEAEIYTYDHNYSQAAKTINDASKFLDRIENLEDRRMSRISVNIQRWGIINKSKLPKNSYQDSLLYFSKKIYEDAAMLKNKDNRYVRVLFGATWAASALLGMGKNKEAEKYFNIAGKQIKHVGMDSFYTADYFELKGDFHYRNKDKNKYYLDSTLANYNIAFKIAEKLDYSGLTNKLSPKIAKIYGEKKDFGNQEIFIEKGEKIRDSLETKINQNLNLVKPQLYQVNNTSKDTKIGTSEIGINKLIYRYGLGGILISMLLFIFYKRHYRKKDALLKNKEYIRELKLLEKSNGEEMVSINKLLGFIGKDDNSFYISFLETYPDFSGRLLKINPTMKPSDIEFCAYIKLNLETKRIAQVKKMSVRAVEGKKYRIRKKLDIATEDNMYIWMSKI